MMNKLIAQTAKALTGLLLPLLLFSAVFSQQKSIRLSTEEDIRENLKTVRCKNSERLDAVKSLFQAMGAGEPDISIEKFDSGLQNLVVKKKGTTNEIVIIGAHYDKVNDGCGAIDNWTGIVVIANLYRTMKDITTDKTYLFVAFDKEEGGLMGSHAMAKAIPKDKRVNYCSMVNLDSFGFLFTQVLENASSPKMTSLAKDMAKEINVPFASASLQGGADADSSSFKEKDIPAITFHGLSNRWQDYLHSSKDKIENIKPESVFAGYQFVLRYLLKIDSSGCDIFRK